ncbi:MAG: dockerin type I repeat-containing protein [Clostridia bacterium]|nr:dockerin type I repeat-containing protein [Clostridia bacterium]
MFIGWYRGDEFISAEEEIEVTEGGEYTARFGGDIDGDGLVSATDALLLMRRCMGLAAVEGINADIDMNGETDALDALLIFRHVLNLN